MTQYLTDSERNFENGLLGGWVPWVSTPEIDVTEAHTGVKSMRWVGVGTSGIFLTARPIAAGAKEMTFSFWRKASVTTPVSVYLRFVFPDTSYVDITPAWNWTPTWTYQQVGGAIPEGAVTVTVYYIAAVSGTFWTDDMSLTDDLTSGSAGFVKRGRQMRLWNSALADEIVFNTGVADVNGCTWWANKLSGWDDADGEATASAKSYDDGAHIEDGYYGPQLITLDGTIACRDTAALRRGKRRLNKIADTMRSDGRLIVQDVGDQELMRNVRRGGVSITTGSTLIKFQLRLVSGDHARLSEVDRVLTVPAAGAGGIPFDQTIEFDPTIEMPANGNSTTAVVNGDAYSWPVITIAGPVIDPVVANDTTGQFVGVDFDVPSGATIEFDMSDRDVRVNGVSIYSSLLPGSSFWKLIPGWNLLRYGGAGSAPMTVTWKDAWV